MILVNTNLLIHDIFLNNNNDDDDDDTQVKRRLRL